MCYRYVFNYFVNIEEHVSFNKNIKHKDLTFLFIVNILTSHFIYVIAVTLIFKFKVT